MLSASRYPHNSGKNKDKKRSNDLLKVTMARSQRKNGKVQMKPEDLNKTNFRNVQLLRNVGMKNYKNPEISGEKII